MAMILDLDLKIEPDDTFEMIDEANEIKKHVQKITELQARVWAEQPKELKNPKDKTIEHAMDQVGDALSGKNFRRILGAIEQQIRYAYKQGYEEGKGQAVTATEEELQKKYEMGVKDGRISSLASYDIGKTDGFNIGYEKGHDIGYDKAIEVALREWKRKKDGGVE